jgi:hypothetical protein
VATYPYPAGNGLKRIQLTKPEKCHFQIPNDLLSRVHPWISKKCIEGEFVYECRKTKMATKIMASADKSRPTRFIIFAANDLVY